MVKHIPIKVYEEIKDSVEMYLVISDFSNDIEWIQEGPGRSRPYKVTTVIGNK